MASVLVAGAMLSAGFTVTFASEVLPTASVTRTTALPAVLGAV